MFLQKIKTYISTLSAMSIPVCTQAAVSTQAHWAALRQLATSQRKETELSRKESPVPGVHLSTERDPSLTCL